MQVKQKIPNLLGGLSVAAPWKRRSNQLGLQIDAIPSPSRGLGKRPPFTELLQLSDAFSPYPYGDSTVEVLDYGDGNVFYLILPTSLDSVEIVDSTGSRKSISYPSGKGYLSRTDGTPYRTVTVGRRTYFLNPEKVVASATPLFDGGTKRQALVWVRENDSDAAAFFSVNLLHSSGYSVTASYTPGDAATSDIASGLATDLQTNDTSGEYTVTQEGSLIHIERVDGEGFSVRDWSSNTKLSIYADQQGAKTMGDLPTENIPAGFIMAVSGNPSTDVDDFYVEWDGEKWEERVEPDGGYRLDWATMPHELLYRPATDDFVFQQIDWEEREAGDATTNPEPSFVDSTINEVFFVEGRLGLISGNNIVLSRAGEPRSFFRETVRTYRDNAPIDVESTAYGASYFHSAIPWNERIYLFSTSGQYVLIGDPVISPRTIQISQVSNYPTVSRLRPLASGGKVFLLSEQGGKAKVLAWTHPSEHPANGVDLTRDISSQLVNPHVYAVDDSMGFLAITGEITGGTAIWVYFYRIAPDGSLYFSNWGQWMMGAFRLVRSLSVVDGKLLALVDDSDTSRTVLLEADVRSAMTEDIGDAGEDPYDMILELTPLYLRDGDDEAETKGRLTVQYLDILFDENDTDVTLTVERPGRSAQVIAHTYSPDGSPEPNMLRVPIRAEGPKTSLRLKGKGCVTGLYWEGNYHTRHRKF